MDLVCRFLTWIAFLACIFTLDGISLSFCFWPWIEFVALYNYFIAMIVNSKFLAIIAMNIIINYTEPKAKCNIMTTKCNELTQ